MNNNELIKLPNIGPSINVFEESADIQINESKHGLG